LTVLRTTRRGELRSVTAKTAKKHRQWNDYEKPIPWRIFPGRDLTRTPATRHVSNQSFLSAGVAIGMINAEMVKAPNSTAKQKNAPRR